MFTREKSLEMKINDIEFEFFYNILMASLILDTLAVSLKREKSNILIKICAMDKKNVKR